MLNVRLPLFQQLCMRIYGTSTVKTCTKVLFREFVVSIFNVLKLHLPLINEIKEEEQRVHERCKRSGVCIPILNVEERN